MAKAIHIHLHDFAGAGFRTQQSLRKVTKDCGCAKCAASKDAKYHTCPECDATFSTSQLVDGKLPPHTFLRKPCPGSGGTADAKARDMQQAYHGYLIKTGLRPDEYYISKDGQHIGTASTLQAAKQIIDQIATGDAAIEATPGGYVLETLSDGVIRERLPAGLSYEEIEQKARALVKKHDDTIIATQRGRKVATFRK